MEDKSLKFIFTRSPEPKIIEYSYMPQKLMAMRMMNVKYKDPTEQKVALGVADLLNEKQVEVDKKIVELPETDPTYERLEMQAQAKIEHLDFYFKRCYLNTLEQTYTPSKLEKLEAIILMNVADNTKQVTQSGIVDLVRAKTV